MGGGAVGGAGAARGDAVAVAVATVAEEGAAFEDFAGAQGFVLSAVLGGGQAVGVCSPLPDVADDVVEAVAVGGEGARGRGGEPAVAPAVVAGEVALPDVAELGARAVVGFGCAPWIGDIASAAARCVFPFGFAG